MLNTEQLKQISKTYAAIKVWFDGFEQIDFNHLDDVMANAKMLKKFHSVHTHNQLLYNPEQKLSLIATEINHHHVNGISDAEHNQLHWLVIRELDKDYGHILIHPESFSHKLSEFFNVDEFDFQQNPEFSQRYHFSSTQPAKAYNFATPDRLRAIEKVNDLVIEINDNKLFASCTRELNSADCVNLVGVISHI